MPAIDQPPPSGLADSSGFYRVLLDSMTEGVSLAGADGVIIYSNPAEHRMFGYEPGELVGKPLIVQGGYSPEEGAALVAAVVAEIRATGRWRGEWLNRRKDGSVFETFSRITEVEFEGRPHWLFVHDDIAEEKAALAALRESETRLGIATEAAALGVWDWDVATGRMTYSGRARAISGLPAEGELTFEQVRATVHPEDLPRTTAMAERALDPTIRSREPYDYRILLPGGGVRHVLAHGEAIFAERGGPPRAVRYVGTIQDVTDRKRIEEALRTSELRLDLALQAAGAAVWDWDIGSGDLEWSAGVFALHDIDPGTPNDRLFDAWAASIHPDDREEAEGAARRAGAEGTPIAVDYRVVRRAGELRWVRSQGIVVAGTDGRPTRVTGINLDVTDQHLEQERLRAEAQSLESAVEARTRERDRMYALSNDLFTMAGFDGYLKTINPAWSRLLGYSESELLGRPFASLIHPDDHSDAADVVAKLISGNSVQRFEDRLICADGSAVWIAWAAVPEGDVFYAVGRDVTREKEREEALRQAQKMEAVGQLTGGIAHDFNNLLQAVHGNLDLIRRRAEDERVQRWAAQGLQAADRGAKLTAQLLAFSRAQKPELRPVVASALIGEIEDMLRRSLGPMVQVRLELADDGAAVLADATQLEMALLNLAINARDAMADGGQVTIRTAACRLDRDAELPPGDYLRIDVSDNGPGMAPAVLQRAFDPFFTTKGVGKGTGLGLSQVYGMARQAGGAARISTREGEGATVTLLLRRIAPAVASAGNAPPEALAGSAGAATVLVVDDDPDVRRFLADSLEALGYAVLEAGDGASGLDSLDRFAPDLLLLDFAMPGMTGAEVADAARRRRPGIPIVFASGYADTAAIDAAVGPGAPMLRKPFRMEELAAVVSNALCPP